MSREREMGLQRGVSAEDLPATSGAGFEMDLCPLRGTEDVCPQVYPLRKNKIALRYYSAFQPMSSDTEEISWVAHVLH